MSTTAHAVGFSFVERLAQDLRDERLELPAFPEAVIRIQRVLQSPDTKTEDVVRILSSEPALAARLLRMANSAEFRRVDQNITDLRKAVARMGFNMVRSVAVAFAMRQLRRKDTYSPTAQLQLEQAWEDSLNASAACFVIAKRFTRLNPGSGAADGPAARARPALHHHALEGRGRAQRRRDAANHRRVAREHRQGDSRELGIAGGAAACRSSIRMSSTAEQDGDVSLTDVLIAAKLLAKGETDGAKFPALRRVGVAHEGRRACRWSSTKKS